MSNVADIRNIDDLTSLEGVTFLKACYQILLRRDIDGIGQQYYQNLIYKGFGKSRIIDQICRSSEYKLQDTELPGLRKLRRGYRCARVPGLGWFARWVFDAEPQDRKSRAIRAIHAQIASPSFQGMRTSSNPANGLNAFAINPSHTPFPNASAEELAMYAYLKQH